VTQPIELEIAVQAMGELEERFFDESKELEREALAMNACGSVAPDHESADAMEPAVAQRMRADVRARRAKFARYVIATMVGCVLLGVAALLKLGIQLG
jgi:Na+-transporting methylmalonyl-CoA/oxaloacetate decarboxylase gamma subunit